MTTDQVDDLTAALAAAQEERDRYKAALLILRAECVRLGAMDNDDELGSNPAILVADAALGV